MVKVLNLAINTYEIISFNRLLLLTARPDRPFQGYPASERLKGIDSKFGALQAPATT